MAFRPRLRFSIDCAMAVSKEVVLASGSEFSDSGNKREDQQTVSSSSATVAPLLDQLKVPKPSGLGQEAEGCCKSTAW